MRASVEELICWVGFAIIGLSVIYSFYLGYWVYFDALLTPRQKLIAYWPCYCGVFTGWLILKIVAKWK